MSLCLVVIDGPDQGKSFELAGVVVLGRDPSAGIVIDDPEVSRRHASITLGGDKLEVEDLESRNGTWVGGERIEDRRSLGEGQKVRVGSTVLQVAGPPTKVAQEPVADDPQATRVTKPSEVGDADATQAPPD